MGHLYICWKIRRPCH